MDRVWNRHKLNGRPTIKQPTDGRWKPDRSGVSHCHSVLTDCLDHHFVTKCISCAGNSSGRLWWLSLYRRAVDIWRLDFTFTSWHSDTKSAVSLTLCLTLSSLQTGNLLNRPLVAWFHCANRNYSCYRVAFGDVLYGEITEPYFVQVCCPDFLEHTRMTVTPVTCSIRNFWRERKGKYLLFSDIRLLLVW